jgi:hypothetical protein
MTFNAARLAPFPNEPQRVADFIANLAGFIRKIK